MGKNLHISDFFYNFAKKKKINYGKEMFNYN